MRVAVDTHIILWGVRREASKGQEKMIPRAVAFLDWLSKERSHVLLPSLVAAEALALCPADRLAEVQDVINTRFMIAAHDAIAAVYAARIYRARYTDGTFQALKGQPGSRRALSLDTHIIGSALAAGAEVLYSNDTEVRDMAKDFLVVREIPEITGEQMAFAISEPPPTSAPPPKSRNKR